MTILIKRRTLIIGSILSSSGLLVALLFTNAHNAPLDELGCHRDPPGSRYHCHTGSLKGKEFDTKEEAERSIASVKTQGVNDSDFSVTLEDTPEAKREKEQDGQLPPPPDLNPKAVVNEKLLKVISWNVRKGDKIEYDRIVNVLAEGDIAVLQGLDLDEKGKGPLHIIGDLLQGRVNEKVCRMWFRNNAQGREHYGILWRTSTVGYVDPGGEIKQSCGEMAVVIPTKKGKGAPVVANAQFFSKVQKKMFQLGTIQLDAAPTNPEKEIPSLFRPLEASNWPTIVVGDVKARTSTIKNFAFKINITKGTVTAKKNRGQKYSSSNIWTRNAVAVRSLHINLYDRFGEMPTKEIESTVSSSFPMLAEVALSAEMDDQLSTMVLKSKKEAQATPPKKESVKAKPAEHASRETFEEPKDDLEAEANSAEGDDTRKPASGGASGGGKHKKKKKKKP